MTLQTLAFLFGALLLLVGILGGGFEIKEIKIPHVPGRGRAVASIVGLVFIGFAIRPPQTGPQSEDHQLSGKQREKWESLGGEHGPLGRVRTDERDAFGGGRYNEFENGYIYWSPQTGVHAVYGEIGKKWAELGRERGLG